MCEVTSDYKVQTAGFKGLEFLVIGEHPYITYDRNIELHNLVFLFKMYFNSYIYRV